MYPEEYQVNTPFPCSLSPTPTHTHTSLSRFKGVGCVVMAIHPIISSWPAASGHFHSPTPAHVAVHCGMSDVIYSTGRAYVSLFMRVCVCSQSLQFFCSSVCVSCYSGIKHIPPQRRLQTLRPPVALTYLPVCLLSDK